MSNIAWGRFLLMTGALIGGGYAMMRATTPTEEQFYNSLAPDLKRKVDEIRAQRAGSQEMRDRLAASAAEEKVVWADETGTKRRA